MKNSDYEAGKFAEMSQKIPFPRWRSISIYELCNNYTDQAALKLMSNAVRIMGNLPESLERKMFSQVNFTDGNSGSRVETLYSHFARQSLNNAILKSNSNPEMNDYEFAVYNLIKDESVAKYMQLPKDAENLSRVAKYFAQGAIPEGRLYPGSLVIEDLGENKIENEIRKKQLVSKTIDELDSFCISKGKELARMISKYDSLLNLKMMQKENAELSQKLEGLNKYSKLEKIFDIDRESAEKNYYMLNIIRSLPGASKKLIELLGPVVESLNESYKNYGSWSIDIKPDNVFYQEGKPRFTDLNYAHRASMQEADAVLVDDVIPIRTGSIFSDKLVLYSPWKEQDRREIINERISEFEKNNGIKIDRADYMKGRAAAKFYISLRRTRQTQEKLAGSRSYIEINKNMEKLQGYINCAFIGLAEFGKEQFGSATLFKEAAEEINEIYLRSKESACPIPVQKGWRYIIEGGSDAVANLRDSGMAYLLEKELEARALIISCESLN